MTDRIPVDSTEAREFAEQRLALEHERSLRQRDHDRNCTRGWLGEDDQGRPIACLVCRPWLNAAGCRTCGITAVLCQRQVDRGRGACCTDCQHQVKTTTDRTTT